MEIMPPGMGIIPRGMEIIPPGTDIIPPGHFKFLNLLEFARVSGELWSTGLETDGIVA